MFDQNQSGSIKANFTGDWLKKQLPQYSSGNTL